jgi:hypothetical protein
MRNSHKGGLPFSQAVFAHLPKPDLIRKAAEQEEKTGVFLT